MANETKEIASCIVCKGSNHSLYATKKGYKVFRCESCRTLFLHPLPELSDAKAVYGQEYFAGANKGHGYVDYDADKEAMRSVFNKHLKHFEEVLGKTGRLFDVGAATGFFMQIAKDRGWNVAGIDISEFAAERGRQKGLNIIAGTMTEVKGSENTYDLITMWDVIEHMRDPVTDLVKVHSMLKKGGLVAVNTPDSGSLYSRLMGSKWHLFVPPEHIWYFNRKSLKRLFEDHGFEVLEVGCVGKKFTIEYVVSFLYRWQKFGFWKKLLDKLEKNRLGKLAIPINLRDNMYLLARKK